jgi:hypothetical protein
MLLNPSTVTGGMPPRFAGAASNELGVTWVASDQSGLRAGDVLTKEPQAEPMQCIAMPVQGAHWSTICVSALSAMGGR